MKVDEFSEQPILSEIVATEKINEHYFVDKIKTLLTTNYFSECKTYNMINNKDLYPLNIFGYEDVIKITSSHNSNREYLRTNLIASLLNVYKFNISHKSSIKPVFEIQKIYHSESRSNLNITLLTPLNIEIDKINNSNIVYNINGLKAVADELFNILNAKVEYKIINNENLAFYNNEHIGIYFDGILIGHIGAIKNSILLKYNIDGKQVYCLSVNIDELIKKYHENVTQYQPVSILNPITKDLTIDVTDKHLDEALNNISNLSFIDK
jgi:phenylalanyl-tRNA synthetase beta subunit